jgi:hypothetical protein
MKFSSRNEYQNFIKDMRTQQFPTPFDLTYTVFTNLCLDQKDSSYVRDNISSMVELLRHECWAQFQIAEKSFSAEMLKSLIDNESINNLSAKDALVLFIENHSEQIYDLSLSNTQSRRSRAGKEFEAIIEILLIGAGISLDSQGNVGKERFKKQHLGKLVDFVLPGAYEYSINKRNTILISAKTTLRERWQEVPEEMGRTGAREMFLATLDEAISSEVLKTLNESNIQIVTTKRNKAEHYPTQNAVMSFEDLVAVCIQNDSSWINYSYTMDELQEIIDNLNFQIDKHMNHPYVVDKLKKRLQHYELLYKDINL